jgi:hypothetical protein
VREIGVSLSLVFSLCRKRNVSMFCSESLASLVRSTSTDWLTSLKLYLSIESLMSTKSLPKSWINHKYCSTQKSQVVSRY